MMGARSVRHSRPARARPRRAAATPVARRALGRARPRDRRGPGLAGGGGAHRTAYPSYLHRAGVGEVVVNPSFNTDRAEGIIASTPGVKSYVSDSLLTATADRGGAEDAGGGRLRRGPGAELERRALLEAGPPCRPRGAHDPPRAGGVRQLPTLGRPRWRTLTSSWFVACGWSELAEPAVNWAGCHLPTRSSRWTRSGP